MKAPSAVGALAELAHGYNWILNSIENFAELITRLHDFLEVNYVKQNMRKKIRLINRPVSPWGTSTKMDSYVLLRKLGHEQF